MRARPLDRAPEPAVDRCLADAEPARKLRKRRVGASPQLEDCTLVVRDAADRGDIAAYLLEQLEVLNEVHRLGSVHGRTLLPQTAGEFAAKEVDRRAPDHAAQPCVEAGGIRAPPRTAGDTQPGVLRNVVHQVAAPAEPPGGLRLDECAAQAEERLERRTIAGQRAGGALGDLCIGCGDAHAPGSPRDSRTPASAGSAFTAVRTASMSAALPCTKSMPDSR